MSRQYLKPAVLLNEDLAEGVFTASLGGGGGRGSDSVTSTDGCFNVTAKIDQKPETGRGDYRLDVNATHIPSFANHGSNSQTLTIVFNQPVDYVSCGTNVSSYSDGTSVLTVTRQNWCNGQSEPVGFAGLVVNSEQGLGLISVKFVCNL